MRGIYVVVAVRATVRIRSLCLARVREVASAAYSRGVEGALRKHVPCPSIRVESDVRNGVPRLPARLSVCVKGVGDLESTRRSPQCDVAKLHTMGPAEAFLVAILYAGCHFCRKSTHNDYEPSTLRQNLDPSTIRHHQDLAEVVRRTQKGICPPVRLNVSNPVLIV